MNEGQLNWRECEEEIVEHDCDYCNDKKSGLEGSEKK